MIEEVLSVSNLSTGVYNKGYNAGYDSGYGSGISAGELKKAKEVAYKLYDRGMSEEDIALTAEISMETLHEWIAEREKNLVK